MRRPGNGERGQALVEFALIFGVLMMMTTGLLDVGRAFYEYNALSSASRFAARWASVVGGACVLPGSNVNDWCTQQGTATGNFWTQKGNVPIQGNSVPCPSYQTTPSDYYSASDPDDDNDNDYSVTHNGDGDTVSNSTTIVGIVAQHFDTSSASTGFVSGTLGGFDLSKLKVCIQTSNPLSDQVHGDYVTVVVSYHFDPINFILASRGGFYLVSTSQYNVEG